MREATITNYLGIFHPQVLQEMQTKMSSIPYCKAKVAQIVGLVERESFDQWQTRMVLLASCLILFSPETIYVNCMARKGVVSGIAEILGVTSQAISKGVDQARYYYQRAEWCRNEVDKIVKEVKG